MNSEASNLIEILKEEQAVFHELVNLSKNEQQYIIEGNIEGILDIASKKERLAHSVQELENKRIKLAELISKDKSTPQNLSSLFTKFDDEIIDQLEDLKSNLLSVISEFSVINQTNAELLKRNLDYINFMLNTIFPSEDPTYKEKPSVKKSNVCLFNGVA